MFATNEFQVLNGSSTYTVDRNIVDTKTQRHWTKRLELKERDYRTPSGKCKTVYRYMQTR